MRTLMKVINIRLSWENVCENNQIETEVSSSDVQKVINSMNNKAADKEGLTAENFKYGGDSIY